MSGETRMTRSVFDAIRETQQIQKYEALNTYNIFLNDKHSIGYEDGVSEHSSFRFLLPDNQSGHIKNAKVRVKGILIGTAGGDVETISSFRVKTNFLKNVYESLGLDGSGTIGRTTGVLGFFQINKSYEPDDVVNEIPEIASAIGSNGNAPANSVFSNVSQNQHTITTTTYDLMVENLVLPISDSFIPCQNPFGKTISFEFLDGVGDLYDLTNNAQENTQIQIEVILLPDNQANDKFTY